MPSQNAVGTLGYLLPKRKIWDSGGGGSVGETVSLHMPMNIGTACALTSYYHIVMYLLGQRNLLGVYQGTKVSSVQLTGASAVLVHGCKEV